jgi:hypothetical protein
MAATPSYPYETRLNILHKPLELIDEKALADELQIYVVQPDSLQGK